MTGLLRLFVSLLLTCLSAFQIRGEEFQDAVEVTGEGHYYLEGDDNVAYAKLMAVQLARSNAIESVFGKAVSSSTHSEMAYTSDGEDRDSFSMMVRTLGMGAWLKDIEPPLVEGFMETDGSFGFRAAVHGLVRELTSVPIETDGTVWVLPDKDRRDMREESSLKVGDRFCFRFRAATDGFLTVYLVDEDGMVNRAAPLMGSGHDTVPIRGGETATIRDTQRDNEAWISEPEQKAVHNRAVFVFSPNLYYPPLESEPDPVSGQPAAMEYDKFHAWLQEMAVRDINFTVSGKTITIRR